MLRGMISNEDGAKTSLYCATSPEVADHNGLYYDECRIKTPSQAAQSSALADELWERSEAYVTAKEPRRGPLICRRFSPSRVVRRA